MPYAAFDLTGKVALITGGNGGIGLGMAEALAEAGADIAIWGMNPAKNEAAQSRLAATGRRILALPCDVRDPKAVDAAFARTLDTLGRVDACFANAGVSGVNPATPFHDMPDEEWRRVLSVNLDGVFHTFRAACRHMTGRGGGGTLAVTASLAAIHGAPRFEHYAATKGAVISMIRGLAVEYARHNIRAYAILPGWVESEMTENRLADPRFQQNVVPRIPLRRVGQPADFGGIAIYLASEAAAWHTGDSFLIDGGYTLF